MGGREGGSERERGRKRGRKGGKEGEGEGRREGVRFEPNQLGCLSGSVGKATALTPCQDLSNTLAHLATVQILVSRARRIYYVGR